MSETITVRTNLYLWMLTGRSDDFTNESLNTGIRYSVMRTPDEVTHVRKLLKLDVTGTDTHVLACLAGARMNTSLLRSMPPDIDGVFVSGLLSLPEITTNAISMLPASGASAPSVDGGRAGLDGFTRVLFTEDGGDVVITTNSGGRERSPYNILQVGFGPDSFRVTVEKAHEYGIRASFEVTSFNLGDVIAVDVTPTRYPFAAVVTKIEADSVTMQLMNSQGTLQAFTESSNPAKKVGMAALAVIRKMLGVINEDQRGFSVTSTRDGVDVTYTISPTFSQGLDDETVDDDAPVGFNA